MSVMDANMTAVASRKRIGKHYTVEDEALDRITKESEARLAARRQARVEARQLRLKELERQQQQQQEGSGSAVVNGDEVNGSTAARCAVGGDVSTVCRTPVRRGSGDSATTTTAATSLSSDDTTLAASTGSYSSVRDLRHELRELEEKLRKTMVSSAQLDNDKSTLTYQQQLLKDKLEDLGETHAQLQREHKARCSEHEQLKRLMTQSKNELEMCRKQLQERDRLIVEHGLVMIGGGDSDSDDTEHQSSRTDKKGAGGATSRPPHAALVSQTAADLLQTAGDGSLDSRLRRLAEEKADLEDQLRRLRLQLAEQRHLSATAHNTNGATLDGAAIDTESPDVQREISRQVSEYRFKLQKSEQEVTNLQTNVQRLENQVQRYKTAAETAEKAEEELKQERRKLQRELRESQNVIEELQTTNAHLKKRLDKLKNARSTLLKDLSAE